MRVYLRRKLRKSLVFIAVVELQRNGNPHLHLLVGSYLPKNWISAAWQKLGGGWATRIEYADVHRVAAYLSKYFTEDSLRDLPDGTRRFSTSRGLALFERSSAEGEWSFVKAPIEYWRKHAECIIDEQHEIGLDGELELKSFTEGKLPGFLSGWSPGRAGPKLWIEVRGRDQENSH